MIYTKIGFVAFQFFVYFLCISLCFTSAGNRCLTLNPLIFFVWHCLWIDNHEVAASTSLVWVCHVRFWLWVYGYQGALDKRITIRMFVYKQMGISHLFTPIWINYVCVCGNLFWFLQFFQLVFCFYFWLSGVWQTLDAHFKD